jgi:hypothetical protein
MTSRSNSPAGQPEEGASRGAGFPIRRAAAALVFSLAVGVFNGRSPLSESFWDPGRSAYWESLYVPGDRAREFEKIATLIPPDSRVASTDFVHPRYTHFERSYDYSDYPRKVAGYEDRVPDDTDYIVIDTRHPYSRVHQPSEVRELQKEPERWELLPDSTNGAFIVLKRRAPEAPTEASRLP